MGLLGGISTVVEQLLDFQTRTVEVGSVKGILGSELVVGIENLTGIDFIQRMDLIKIWS